MLTVYPKESARDKNAAAAAKRYLLTAPTEEEMAQVSETCGINPAVLKSALDYNALSRIHFNQITSVFVDMPFSHNTKDRKRVKTAPLGLFITDTGFVAVSKQKVHLVEQIFEDERIFDMSGNELLFYILYSIALLYMRYLNQIDQDTEQLENHMRQKVNNNEIFQLMDYQRSLTAMTTSLKGMKRLLIRIRENSIIIQSPDLLEDAGVAIEQASEMADIFNADLDALMDAFGSVLSNNVNQIMKILTSLTLIIAIPTMVAGFFGMNVGLPIDTHPLAFWIILGLSLMLSILTGIIFYRKRFL